MPSTRNARRFAIAYLWAALASTLAASLVVAIAGLLIVGGGSLSDYLALLLFSAIYAVPAVTLLGPLGFIPAGAAAFHRVWEPRGRSA